MILLLATALSGCTKESEPVYEPGPVGRIDGAVLDHMLGPWPNIKVHLVEMARWTETNELGGFSFLDGTPGFHTIEVDIPDVGMDREMVAVDAWKISQIILQVWDVPERQPYVSKLEHKAKTQIAEPGQICDECRWVTSLHAEKPVAVTFMAVWNAQFVADVETHLRITIVDDDGNLITPKLDIRDEEVHPDGRRMVRAFIDGEHIPEGNRRLLVEVAFDDQNRAPHIDFEMESFLHLHYGMTDEAKALLA